MQDGCELSWVCVAAAVARALPRHRPVGPPLPCVGLLALSRCWAHFRACCRIGGASAAHQRPFLLLLHVRPLVWLAHMTFGSELWDFELKCQAFLWRIPQVSKVCPSTIWRLLMVITDKRRAGSWKFKAAYKRALSIEKKSTFGLNSLVEKLSSWVTITCSHGICEDTLSDAITLEQYRKL